MSESERQTLSYLQRRFDSARIQPQTKFGQNFLIDLNLVRLLAESAELGPRDVVLEVGTGMGSLTSLMAKQAGHVVTVEIDRHLAALARAELSKLENVTLLEQDALKNKNQLHPILVETVRQRISEVRGGRLKLVANLPYNVATPILSNLLDVDPWPCLMVATIQKELAQRITAQPRTKDYSGLSVWMQAQCKCEIIRLMPPSVFWPRPKVDSAILRVQPQKVLRNRIVELAFFHTLVRNIFLHRRKLLRSALLYAVQLAVTQAQKNSPSPGNTTAPLADKQSVDEVLSQLGLDPMARAEQLSPLQLIELSEFVRKKLVTSTGLV